MSLSTLSLILGLVYGTGHLYGFIKPDSFKKGLLNFPRSNPWGYVLMLMATLWFLWNVQQENISDFEPYKPIMVIGFALVGVGSCFFLRDFLSIRALAVLMLLMAKMMVDTARWADSPFRLIITTWAYVWVIAGMWLTISPWRMRDMIQWFTADPTRMRLGCAVRAGFGFLVALLGLFVF